MQEDFVGLAAEMKVARDTADFIWEASGGDFDAALDMLGSQAVSAGGGEGGGKAEEAVRAPILPTRRHVLVGEHEAGPWGHAARSGAQRAPEEFNPFHRSAAAGGEKNELLERMYRPPVEIVFVGDFGSAAAEAAGKNKLLLVNVQEQSVFACQLLNRDTWSDQRLKRFVSERFVLWQPHADSSDGRYYLQFYQVSSYPHIAVIDPTTRFRELVLEGLLSPDELQTRLAEFLSTRPDGAAVAAAEPEEMGKKERVRGTDLTEQEQLERAIRESLQQEESGVDEDDVEARRKLQIQQEQDQEEGNARGAKKRKTDGKGKEEAEQEPPGSGLPPDTTLRVRDAAGQQKTIRVHGSDTMARLAWQVAKEFGLEDSGSFHLTTVMPKVFVTALPPQSQVRSHGLGGSTLVMQMKEPPA